MATVLAGVSLMKSSDGEWAKEGKKMPRLFATRDSRGAIWVGFGGYAILIFTERSVTND